MKAWQSASLFLVCLSLLLLAPLAIAESGKPEALQKLVADQISVRIENRDVSVKGRHGLQIEVTNNSDRAVILNGELATARLADKDYGVAILDEFEGLPGSQPRFLAELNSMDDSAAAQAAVSVSSWKTVNDMLKSESTRFTCYGKGEQKRRSVEHRFGQRILWPGDSSSGIIVFNSPEPLVGAVLSIPVRSFFEPSDIAVAKSKAN